MEKKLSYRVDTTIPVYGMNRKALVTLKCGELVEQLVRAIPEPVPDEVTITLSVK